MSTDPRDEIAEYLKERNAHHKEHLQRVLDTQGPVALVDIAATHLTNKDSLVKFLARTADAASAAEISRLTVELEEARKDARRYRWLVNHKHVPWGFLGNAHEVGIDEAIDAAMTKEKL
jgi:hypothetical protein